MSKDNEEVLLKVRDFGWPEERYWDVTLITHSKGDFSLHMQTGEYHADAIDFARIILAKRGLVVGKSILLGPSGMYYEVRKAH